MAYIQHIIIFILVFFLLGTTTAQQPHHIQFSTLDGLPSNTIYDIIQDSNGYIWAGTENGLVKFNGKEFKIINDDKLDNNEISYLHEVPDGSIWAVTFGNRVIRIVDDTIQVPKVFEPFYGDTEYFELFNPRDSLLILRSKDRIASYNIYTEKIKVLFDIKNNGERQIEAVSCNKDKIFFMSLVFGNINNLFEIDINTSENKLITNSHAPYTAESHIFPGDTLVMWGLMSDEVGIFYINDNQLDFYQEMPSIRQNQKLETISIVDSSEVWFNTIQGSFRKQDGYHLLPNEVTTKVIKDIEGNYWVASYNSGIFLIPHINISKNLKIPSTINQLVSDSENLFIGTSEGDIIKYNISKKQISSTTRMEYPSIKSMDIDTTQSIFAVNNSSSYYGSTQTENIQLEIARKTSNMYRTIQIYKNYIFYFAKWGLILEPTIINESKPPPFHLNPLWEEHPLKKDLSLFKESMGSNLNTGLIDKDEIWLLLHDKMLLEKNQKLIEIQKEGKDIIGSCIAKTHQGQIIIGDIKHGYRLEKDYEFSSVISNAVLEKFGQIRKIICTKDYIIFLTDIGILVADQDFNIIRTYDETDGIIGSKINDLTFQNGVIYLGTVEGLYEIDVPKTHDNLSPIPTIITDVFIENEKFNSKNNKARFDNKSDIDIYFEGLSYKGNNVFHYEYKLNESDEWKILSSLQNSIRLPNMSYGNYKFQIRAINEENIMGESSSFPFKILRPIWLRWWFIIIAVLLVSTILYLYYKRTLQRIEKENQYEQEIRTNKLSALQARMNPHFIFNSLNSIQDFIIKLDKMGANEYLGTFSDLMRIYLRHSEKDQVELQEEIDALKMYLKLEQLRFEDISVDFEVDHELYEMDLFVPPLFIQPYIENAFKHGLLHKLEDKRLKIAFKLDKENRLFKIIIEDNGVGRDKVEEIKNKSYAKGLSYSTNANKTRLELLNHNRTRKLSVKTVDLYEENTPTGTQVIITIPILD